jgi:predicted enzyme related to lactoylglutathione lyase
LPGRPAGATLRASEEEVPMSDRVVHFEIPYDDAERARGFYAEVFGWQINPIPALQGMPTEPGFIGGGMTQRGDTVPRPVITIAVADIDETLEKVRARGGSAVGEKVPVADMGTAAYFRDSEGNLMGLWQNAT